MDQKPMMIQQPTTQQPMQGQQPMVVQGQQLQPQMMQQGQPMQGQQMMQQQQQPMMQQPMMQQPMMQQGQQPMVMQQGQPQMMMQNTTTVVTTGGAQDKGHENLDVNDLALCSACLCSNTALYCDPKCIGWSGKGACCCIQSENCCKLGGNLGCGCNGNPGDCCVCRCFCCSYGLVNPETCCLGQQHCCCLVSSTAFPCTEDIPCMCTCLPGLVICPKCGCCMKIGDVTGKGHGGQTVVIHQSTGYTAMAAIDMVR